MSQKATASKTTDSKSSTLPARVGRTAVHSQVSPQEQFLQLHKQFGNRAVQRMYESGVLQAKLKIGQPGDKYEQEADRVADQVMRMPDSNVSRQEDEEEVQGKPVADQITPLVQRQSEEEEEIKKQPEEEEEPVQTKPLQRQPEDEEEVQTQPEEDEETAQAKFLQRPEEEEVQTQPEEEEEEPVQAKRSKESSPEVSPSFDSGIKSMRGGGQPLPKSSRAYFEPRFGADFSSVKIHTNTSAMHMARSINAKAFTFGKDVVFGEGQYSPQTSNGKRLMAHELTHVVQQEGVQPPPASPISQSTRSNIVQTVSTKDTAMIRRKVSSQYSKIIENMSYSVTDFAVTDEEAQEVVAILKRLGPVDLQDTLDKLKKEEGGKYYRRLIDNLPEADFLFEHSWLMPPYPQVADAADSLAGNTLIMDSYVNFRNKTWSWYFSKNASLKPYHKTPDQFNSWDDWVDLASSQTGIRKRMVIANLGGFDNNSFRSIKRNAADLQKLISGFNRWPNDWYAIFQSSEEKATNTCNIFVGESLFIAGKNTVKGGGKYHSAEEVYDGDGPFIQIEPGAFSRGDIDADGSHTDVIVSVTPGTRDFTARNGYSRGRIRPRNLKDWRILRLA